MNTNTSKKINKSAAKEVNRIANSQVDLTAAMVRDLLYNYDHELLRIASKLHKRRYLDDLLNRKVYRMAVMPYGGMQRWLLINQFCTALGKCLACIEILEDSLGPQERFSMMIDDWNYLLDKIERGDFDFVAFEDLFEHLDSGKLG